MGEKKGRGERWDGKEAIEEGKLRKKYGMGDETFLTFLYKTKQKDRKKKHR